MASPPGKAIINSIAAAVTLSKASAIPAVPVGNMEKSLCIAPTLTTSYRLDKREKGVREATLLRGVRGLPKNILCWPQERCALAIVLEITVIAKLL
jgi:hypothetical protein